MSLPSAGTKKTPGITHLRKLEGHTSGVLGVINVPGARRIITCSADGSLRVWNLQSGLQIGKDWRDGESKVYAIALSPDRKKVVSGDQDSAVKLWDVSTGKVIAKWTGHTEEVRSVCWSQDGLRVLSGSTDATTRVWNAGSGETILGPLDTGLFLFAVAYSTDETLIAAGGYQYTGSSVQIWDAKTGKLVATLRHQHMVACIAWTADGKTLISGSEDHLITLWNTTTWEHAAVWPEHHTRSVDGIAISPNGRILATVSADCTAQLWNLEHGQPISSPLQHLNSVSCVSFSTDGLLITGCDDCNAYIWDAAVIIKEAGLDDLLLNSDAMQADATRRPTRPPNETRKVPQGFFDSTQGPSSTGPPPRSFAHQSSPRTLFDRFPSLFRPHPAVREDAAHEAPTPFRPLNWARAILSRGLLKRHQPDTELVERHPPEVQVPYTRGLARNVKVERKSEKKKLPVPGNIMAINVTGTGTSQAPNGGDVQQSDGVAQGQQSSLQPQVLLATTPAAATAATNSSSTGAPHPDVVIRQPGYWTRFWLSLGCVSAENAASTP